VTISRAIVVNSCVSASGMPRQWCASAGARLLLRVHDSCSILREVGCKREQHNKVYLVQLGVGALRERVVMLYGVELVAAYQPLWVHRAAAVRWCRLPGADVCGLSAKGMCIGVSLRQCSDWAMHMLPARGCSLCRCTACPLLPAKWLI
jgi:hypothetical protein